MKLTDSQLKGNWGEQFIASELAAQGCLVRHVTQGHDTGVDLYCETTWNGIPFLHFWCQIKTTKKESGQKETILYRPPQKNKKHIDYWLRQPVPVFVFVIPSSLRDKPLKKPYYICSPLRIENGTMPSFLKVKHPTNIFHFLHNLLVDMTQQWDLKDGRLTPILKPGFFDDFIGFEAGMTGPYTKEILRSIHWGLWRLFYDTLGDESERTHMFYDLKPLSPERKQKVKAVQPYVESLKCLIKKAEMSPSESFYIIGQFYELEKSFEEALDYYNKALLIIDNQFPVNSQHHHNVSQAVRRIKERAAAQKSMAPKR